MKVKELIELLSEMNPEHEVILSKDGEGNAFSPCGAHDVGQYVPDSTWSGEWRSSGLPPDDGGCTQRQINAILLWPTN